MYVKSLLCPSTLRAMYHLPYISHYQGNTTIFVARCSGFILNYLYDPTRNLFITQYRQKFSKNLVWHIWRKSFLPLSREIVASLDKQSHLQDFHAVNKLLHVLRITFWIQDTQYRPAVTHYYRASLLFLFPNYFMLESFRPLVFFLN